MNGSGIRRRQGLAAAVAVAGLLCLGSAPATAATAHHAPVIFRVGPQAGSAAGGTAVTIIGKNFSHVRYVLFGYKRGTDLRVISSRRLTVVTPQHYAVVAAVTVVTAYGRATSPASQAFVFNAPPAPAFSGVTAVKMASGYSFNVGYSLYIGRPYTESAADPIGYTSVFVPVTVSMSVTNTTPGRAIDFGGDQGDDTFTLSGSQFDFWDWDFDYGGLGVGGTATFLKTYNAGPANNGQIPDNSDAIAQAEDTITQQSYFYVEWDHQERDDPDGTPDTDTTAVCESSDNPTGISGDAEYTDVLVVGPGNVGGAGFGLPGGMG